MSLTPHSLFRRLLVDSGMVSTEDLSDCLEVRTIMSEMGVNLSMSKILLDKGLITDEQADILMGDLDALSASMDQEIHDLANEKLLRDVPRDDQGRPLLGGMSLLSRIGEGGMATIYHALDPKSDRPVAIKVMKASDFEDSNLRFVREGRLAAQIDSPFLIKIYDVGVEHGLYYLVEEYIAGSDAAVYLNEVVLQSGRGLREDEALDVVAAAARGAAEAHRQRIIHRDIKPENILIPRRENEMDLRAAKLLDLGLAKPLGEVGLTGAYIGLGTPGFMSPEQIQDARSASYPSDVFGLGATLYTLLAASTPFEGNTVNDVYKLTIRGKFTPLDVYRSDISEKTVNLIERCIQVDPDDRYADAGLFLQALDGSEG